MTKLDMMVGKGTSYNNYTFSMKFNIKNNDTKSIPLSAMAIKVFGNFPYNTQTAYDKFLNITYNVGTLERFKITQTTSTQSGFINLDTYSTKYTIYHEPIDFTKLSPLLSLIVPTGGSEITPLSISNRTSTSFDIVIAGPAPTSGYQIFWNIPGSIIEGDDSTIPVTLPKPNINISTYNFSIINKKLHSNNIIISWPTSDLILEPKQMISNCEITIEDTQKLTNVTNWYSSLTDTIEDNGTICLYELINGIPTLVVEYKENGSIDGATGKEPTPTNNILKSVVDSTRIELGQPNPYPGVVWIKLKPNCNNLLHITTPTKSAKRAIARFALYNSVNFNNIDSIALYNVNRSWIYNEATWTKASNSLSWSTSGGDYYGGNSQFINPKSNQDYTDNSSYISFLDFDITNIYNGWVSNPSSNLGLLLKAFGSNTYDLWLSTHLTNTPISIYVEEYATNDILPTLSITNSIRDTYLFNTTSFNISATSSITSGSIDSLSAYYTKFGSSEVVSLGSIYNGNNTFTNLENGDYNIWLEAITDKGVICQSAIQPFTFIKEGFRNVNTTIYNSSFYNNNPNIGNFTLKYGVNVSDRFKDPIVTITSGSYTQSLKIDKDPTYGYNRVFFSASPIPLPSGDYSFNTTIVNHNSDITINEILNIKQYVQSLSIKTPTYSFVTLKDNTMGDAYYIPQTATLSANVSGSSGSILECWEVDGNIKIKKVGQSTLPTSTIQISATPSTYEYNFSTYRYYALVLNGQTTSAIKAYVKNPKTPKLSLKTTLNDTPIVVGGMLYDYDTTNTLIKYSTSAMMYENTTYKGLGVLDTSIDGYSYTYNYYSTSASSTYFEIRNKDNYGYTNSTSLALSNKPEQFSYNNVFSNNVFRDEYTPTYNYISLVSATSITLSASMNITDTIQKYFTIVENNISADYPMSLNNTLTLTLDNNKLYSIYSTLKTNSGFKNTSSPLNIICDNGPQVTINLPFCESCYCSNGNISITGNIAIPNKSIYSSVGINYTFNNTIYDSNNTIIRNNLYDGLYVVTWNNPTKGVSNIRLETSDSFGKIYTTTKTLPITIQQAPIINLISPQ